MWPFKKKQEKTAITPERRYEVLQEMDRLKEEKDDQAFVTYCLDHFEEIPTRERKITILALYKTFREVGQVEAEELVADRLHYFPSEVRSEIIREVWGSPIEDYFANDKWKTGRAERPYNVDE